MQASALKIESIFFYFGETMNIVTVYCVAVLIYSVSAIGPIGSFGIGNLGKVPKCEPSPTTTSGTYGTHTGELLQIMKSFR